MEPSGALWTGTGGWGLCRFDGEEWQLYHPTNSRLPFSVVRALAETEDALWAILESPVAAEGAVARQEGETWRILTARNSGLASDLVYCVIEDGGALWFATRAGLSRWEPGERS